MTPPSQSKLFDQLCLRWAREAELMLVETGAVPPTLVVLPRDAAAEEVAIRLDGLRGNLTERGPQLVAEIRPAVTPHDAAGLVFMAQLRLGTTADRPGEDGVAVYVTLGSESYRRALGYAVDQPDGGPVSLRRLDEDPEPTMFSWLDELLRR